MASASTQKVLAAPERGAVEMPLSSRPPAVVAVPAHLTARLLYMNPVCLLATPLPQTTTTGAAMADRCNLMTISWLTPTDNKGSFFMSMNRKRASADFLLGQDPAEGDAVFALSVATAGMEDTLVAVGSTSGRQEGGGPPAVGEQAGKPYTSKAKRLNLPLCSPGWARVADAS